MTDGPDELILRLVGGDPAAEAEVVAAAGDTDVRIVVAAAVLTGDAARLDAADHLALQPRERQLVALARTLVAGDTDRFDALVRDHLASYPDQLLAAWLAARTRRSSR